MAREYPAQPGDEPTVWIIVKRQTDAGATETRKIRARNPVRHAPLGRDFNAEGRGERMAC